MARPAMILLLYLIWAQSLLLYGWLGLFGSDCLNAYHLLLELKARFLSAEAAPPFFCHQDSLGAHAFWMGILFFSFLPGLLTLASLWAWDWFHGRRHIDLTV